MKRLSADIQSKAEETEFSGVVSICRDQDVIFESAFGYRDVANAVFNTTATRFGIASATKLFTALGIGKLIDSGKLALDTTISDLPIQNDGYIDPTATVENLLSHTSGIFDYYDEEIIEDFDNYSVAIPWSKLETPMDYLPLFLGQTMKHKPECRFSYSNGGYVFLGMIIEAITGVTFREFICENVLKPARMDSSGFFALNDLPGNTATGYFEDRRTSNIFQLPIRGGGDGGMFTTIDNLKRLWRSLAAGNIISRELFRQYTVVRHRFRDDLGYGRGLYLFLDRLGYAIIGSDAGVGCYSAFFPADRITITIISNVSGGEGVIKKLILENLESMTSRELWRNRQ